MYIYYKEQKGKRKRKLKDLFGKVLKIDSQANLEYFVSIF